MPTALITGISGQDGSYLAEFLLEAGYRVVGVVRDSSARAHSGVEFPPGAVDFVEGDLQDTRFFEAALRKYRPTEVYNFAAVHPASSELTGDAVTMGDVNGFAVARMLDALRAFDRTIRFCQASSARVYGRVRESPQTEDTLCDPDSPYGIAKLYAQLMTRHYRTSCGMFACSCILFNHESPRRPEKFVTRKITLAAARIKAGLQQRLCLDDLDARRDWGYAPDYVRAMWSILQAPEANDYVLATGETHSVRQLCKIAFEHVGLDYESHVIEGVISRKRDETANIELVGDASRARRVLGWCPTVTFEELIKLMVDADTELLASRSVNRVLEH